MNQHHQYSSQPKMPPCDSLIGPMDSTSVVLSDQLGKSAYYDDPPEVIPSDIFPQTPPPASPSPKASSPNVAFPSHSLFGCLVPDPSQYTNEPLTPTREENDGTTLEELAHVVRLSKYQEHKRSNTRLRLHRHLILTALSARFSRCSETSHRHLVDFFRSDDKKAFASLYTAIQNVRASAEEYRQFALIECNLKSLSGATNEIESLDSFRSNSQSNASSSYSTSVNSFFNALLPTTRDVLLKFLVRIRTDPNYLADRLCSLSMNEFLALTNFNQGLDTVDSVLPYPSRSSTRGHAVLPNRNGPNSMSAVERMLSFHRKDPLSALIHTCFANSAGPDSLEDKRRIHIWANACAKLISTKKGLEPILVSIINVWASMWDWSGKSNIEWYIMRILEEGAFILDRAEDQQGTRFNLRNWTTSDDVTATVFYEKAVSDFFGIIDDVEGTGIPDGFLELGNEILKRLPPQHIESTRAFLISRWLFQSFLTGVLTHPEGHGILTGYHITRYGREKILRQVALRAMNYVNDFFTPQSSSTSIPPHIKTHIMSISGRLRGRSSSQRVATKLLPARAITSLRETKEVHPYLVVSPADLVTMVNGLWPERRHTRPRASSMGYKSVAPSISGYSTLSQPLAQSMSLDTQSSLSISATSNASDLPTSVLTESLRTLAMLRSSSPAGGNIFSASYDPTAQSVLNIQPPIPEDEGSVLRGALQDMTKVVGPEAVQGTAHPYAESWAVLFISSDGKELSTNMIYDPEEDDDAMNDGFEGKITFSDSEDDEDEDEDKEDGESSKNDVGLDFAKDFKEIRTAILKLVEEYEIPHSLEQTTTSKARFSNRMTSINQSRPRNKQGAQSRNPYREHMDGTSSPGGLQPSPMDNKSHTDIHHEEPILIQMLRLASARSESQSDFSSALLYFRTLQNLIKISSPSLREKGFRRLLSIFSRGPRDTIRRSTAAIEQYDAWLVWLKQCEERHEGQIECMAQRLRALRDKMWYVADVVNSAPYNDSRSICVALKAMGMPHRQANRKLGPVRGNGFNSSYIHLAEFQLMELLAASDANGGPNKLSDEQSENTGAWLRSCDTALFCKGEERIHRFCVEMDRCMAKLVGETISDAPVLWSSELYEQDWKLLEQGRTRQSQRQRERDSGVALSADDASGVISDSGKGRFGGFGARPSSTLQSLRSGQTSFLGMGLGSRGGEVEPAEPISFWSPFQHVPSSRVSTTSYGPSSSASFTNISSTFSHPVAPAVFASQASALGSMGRPGTSTSSNDTVFSPFQPPPSSDEKLRFLAELKQTLMSLLLSDLGNLVFAKGSETDEWFGQYGQICIMRQLANERSEQEASLETKTQDDLIDGGSHETSEAKKAYTRTDFNPGEAVEFPFKKAYQRLLQMFSVHPSPYAKLDALHGLTNLVTAAISTSGNSRRFRYGLGVTDISSAVTGSDPARPNILVEDTADNINDGNTASDSRSAVMPQSNIVHMKALVDIFRDPTLRPKTLYRDLQFVATFVPNQLLVKTERGLSFWDIAAAAVSMKMDVGRVMLNITDEIIQVDSLQTKGRGKTIVGPDSTDPVGSAPGHPTTPAYTMADAAKMLTILAKEGDEPAAQRELALLYMARPELLERVLTPLSKPQEVFKKSLIDVVEKREGESKDDGGDVRSDPTIMCLAVHWMEKAARGGDRLARNFMRQRQDEV